MPLPEIVDCHTHTFFSDGEGTFEENVRAALAAGCTTLASTDHLTLPREMDPDCECSVPETDLNELRESFLNVQEQAAAGEFGEAGKRLELVYGFEADWYEGCEANIARWRGDAVFLLGSIHFIDGMAIDYDKEMDIWDDWGPDAVWRAYVERWCRACFCGRMARAPRTRRAAPTLRARDSTPRMRNLTLRAPTSTLRVRAPILHLHTSIPRVRASTAWPIPTW